VEPKNNCDLGMVALQFNSTSTGQRADIHCWASHSLRDSSKSVKLILLLILVQLTSYAQETTITNLVEMVDGVEGRQIDPRTISKQLKDQESALDAKQVRSRVPQLFDNAARSVEGMLASSYLEWGDRENAFHFAKLGVKKRGDSLSKEILIATSYVVGQCPVIEDIPERLVPTPLLPSWLLCKNRKPEAKARLQEWISNGPPSADKTLEWSRTAFYYSKAASFLLSPAEYNIFIKKILDLYFGPRLTIEEVVKQINAGHPGMEALSEEILIILYDAMIANKESNPIEAQTFASAGLMLSSTLASKHPWNAWHNDFLKPAFEAVYSKN
jgi:hypothetical protein